MRTLAAEGQAPSKFTPFAFPKWNNQGKEEEQLEDSPPSDAKGEAPSNFPILSINEWSDLEAPGSMQGTEL